MFNMDLLVCNIPRYIYLERPVLSYGSEVETLPKEATVESRIVNWALSN